MTIFSMLLTVIACEPCYLAKLVLFLDPEGQAHPNQHSKFRVNLEQTSVHVILTASKYNVNPK